MSLNEGFDTVSKGLDTLNKKFTPVLDTIDYYTDTVTEGINKAEAFFDAIDNPLLLAAIPVATSMLPDSVFAATTTVRAAVGAVTAAAVLGREILKEAKKFKTQLKSIQVNADELVQTLHPYMASLLDNPTFYNSLLSYINPRFRLQGSSNSRGYSKMNSNGTPAFTTQTFTSREDSLGSLDDVVPSVPSLMVNEDVDPSTIAVLNRRRMAYRNRLAVRRERELYYRNVTSVY